MRVSSFMAGLLAGAGVLFVASCASNVNLPRLESNHPAHPDALAAPLMPTSQTLRASESITVNDRPDAGMEHGSIENMEGMDHGSMEGMNHGGMHDLHGMEPGKLPSDKREER